MAKTGAKRGRPPVPIERDPQRFEIACWWAFTESGLGSFDAARRALLAVKGGPISLQDIEGVLHMASATIPLPLSDQLEPDQGLRQLAAKAKRAKPEPWLINSAALVQGLITFIGTNNMTGICLALEGLQKLGWRPIIMGLAQRVEDAVGSNLPPADLTALGPQARKLVERLTGGKFPKRRHRKK
jgi:hypothetical protein